MVHQRPDPRPPASARARWLPLAPMLLVACSSAPPLMGDPHLIAETVTVTPAGLLPAAAVRVPLFGTVVFRNEMPEPVDVDVERRFAPSDACSTTAHFAAMGESSVARAIPPLGVASICFHGPGQFPFVVRTTAGERRGSITVGGEP